MAEKQPHTQSSRLEVGEDRREPLMFQRTADRDGDGDGDEQAGVPSKFLPRGGPRGIDMRAARNCISSSQKQDLQQ
jgi:hypothetical protein